MVEIRFIGTGSGVPSTKRCPSAILLKVDKVSYLFDAGDGCARELLRYESDYQSIKAIFISHFHPDHFAGLPFLIQGMHLEKRNQQVKIFTPPVKPENLFSYLAQNLIFKERVGFIIEFLPISEGLLFTDENVEIEAIKTGHLEKLKTELFDIDNNMLYSFGFIIRSYGLTICYSSDLASFDDLGKIKNGDILILDGMHLPLSEIPRFIENHPYKRLIITHISPEKEELVGCEELPVEWAYDGMLVRGGEE